MRRAVALSGLLTLGCSRGPDVVLLTVDTLRVDHVSAFDPDSPARTPAIDGLAADGIRFTQAWSPISVTGPAFCTLHTGKLPGTHGVVMNVFRGGPILGTVHTTLAEQFGARGHRTGGFVSGFTLRRYVNLDQGFQTWSEPDQSRNRTGRLTRADAEAWLDGQPADTPLFLWYHSFDPHGPLARWGGPVGEAAREWRSDPAELLHYPKYQVLRDISEPSFYAHRYERAVGYADEQVGAILDRLRRTGRYDDALIIFTADHGESFTERGLWFDHGFGAWAEQLHVPLVVKLPGNARAGEVVDTAVGLEDVYPTVLEVAGIAPPGDIDGRSLLHPAPDRVFLGESSHCKRNLVFPCGPAGARGKQLVARDATHTVLQQNIDGVGLFESVYDRRRDPTESNPVAIPPPAHLLAAIAPVRAARDALTVELPAWDQGEADAAAKEEQEALKSLGYLDD